MESFERRFADCRLRRVPRRHTSGIICCLDQLSGRGGYPGPACVHGGCDRRERCRLADVIATRCHRAHVFGCVYGDVHRFRCHGYGRCHIITRIVVEFCRCRFIERDAGDIFLDAILVLWPPYREVKDLQSLLAGKGYLSSANASGFFGSLTLAAVRKKFQCYKSIVCAGGAGWGTVGPKTRDVLNSLTSSSTAATTAEIQTLEAELAKLEAQLSAAGQ